MTEEQFDQVIAVHLKGTWNGLRAAAAVMREQGSGAIVEHVVDLGQGRADRSDQLLGRQGNRHRQRHDRCCARNTGVRVK